MLDMDTDLFGEPITSTQQKIANKGEVVSEITPGKLVSHVDVWELPEYVLSKFVPQGDGTYRIEVVEEWLGWICIKDIKSRLGLKGVSIHTLHRLCTAGWIEHAQPTPQIFLVKLDSFIAHLERTKNTRTTDNGFWTKENRKLWSATCGL